MLPTMPIATVGPAAPRAEPAQPQVAAGNDEADAFALVLQHAQHPPTAARDAQTKTAPSGGDAKAKPTQTSEPHDAAREPAASTPSDAGHDAAHQVGGDETVDAGVPTNTPPTDPPATPAPPPLPMAGVDVMVVPHAVVDPHRATGAPQSDDDDAATATVEGRVAPGRTAARGAAHDLRIASTPGRPAAASPPDATGRDDATAATAPLRAMTEQHVSTPGSSGTAATRAASFASVLSGESTTLPPALPTATASPLHDTAAAATPDSKLAHASLHAGIEEPQFGTALGHQVALWVRDGVQEARLQLHPAELGPVTVQIALDGQAAHVAFGAAVAATRDSIEQSLPALAAALRESGFTLVGGGVSSQAGQRGDGDAPRGHSGSSTGDRSHIDAAGDPGAVTAAPRRWARSLLDVYA